jgi:pyruvate dehydrogenase E2 component (dihydrolipoamide acetyltransferase)
VVCALRNHPRLNASYDAEREEILVKRYYDLGIAVDTDEGLMVPVLRSADQKDLLTIARELDDLAARARQRRLRLEELRGATFTISSLGPLGGAFATPIIHQPEMAIVGLHAIKERPVVVDGQVVPRKVMFVSLSYDHRFIDGAVGARFVTELVDLLQSPELLFLGTGSPLPSG